MPSDSAIACSRVPYGSQSCFSTLKDQKWTLICTASLLHLIIFYMLSYQISQKGHFIQWWHHVVVHCHSPVPPYHLQNWQKWALQCTPIERAALEEWGLWQTEKDLYHKFLKKRHYHWKEMLIYHLQWTLLCDGIHKLSQFCSDWIQNLGDLNMKCLGCSI